RFLYRSDCFGGFRAEETQKRLESHGRSLKSGVPGMTKMSSRYKENGISINSLDFSRKCRQGRSPWRLRKPACDPSNRNSKHCKPSSASAKLVLPNLPGFLGLLCFGRTQLKDERSAANGSFTSRVIPPLRHQDTLNLTAIESSVANAQEE